MTDQFGAGSLHVVEPGHTDEESAAEFLDDARPLLASLAAVMQRARRDGFELQFNVGVDNFGRYTPTAVVLKVFGRL
jgi:hypothetical protein